MKPSLYLETTIPSYLAARTSNDLIIAGRQAVTHEFYEAERYRYELCISDYVLQECSGGDSEASKRRLNWLKGVTVLENIPEIAPLAETYLQLLSIPQKSKIDAFHLAVCCVYRVNILLSWNCTHLGVESMQIIQKYNDTHGLSTPQMITPDSLVGKYKEVDFNG